MNRYIDLLESLLREFELTPGGTDLPPVAVEEPKGGRNQQGEYWIKGSKLVAPPKDRYGHSDWCMSAYLAPEAFGLTSEQILQIAETEDEWTADVMKRGLEPNHSGARTLFETILLDRGWGLVTYDLPSRMTIRASKEYARQVASDVANRFSLLQCDHITLYEVNTLDTKHQNRVKSYEFHSEDYGYGGAFSAMMRAAGGKADPAVRWAYKQIPDPNQGIQPQHGLVNHGNATYRNQYYVTYTSEKLGRQLRDKGNWVRFPTSLLKDCVVTTKANQYLAYSHEPFSIPASALQAWNGRQWVPVK